MKKIIDATVVLLFMASMYGCAGYGMGGAVLGGAAGAGIGQAIGHTTEATLIGAAVGTMLGYIAGNEMDKYDQQNVAHAVNVVPSGQTYAWQNPDTGNNYKVTPQPAYNVPTQQGTKKVCRKAIIKADIAGEGKKQTVATACFNEWNQQWEIQ